MKLSNINTLGPNHATELVTTISSVVAVSRVVAPLVFLLALISYSSGYSTDILKT